MEPVFSVEISMKLLDVEVSEEVYTWMSRLLLNHQNHQQANTAIFDFSGITNFFADDEEFEACKKEIHFPVNHPQLEYGDFQTNRELALKVAAFVKMQLPEHQQLVIVEPTCGKGNLMIAALQSLKGIAAVYGVEIYKPYLWQNKLAILQHYLTNPAASRAVIELFHENVFDFDFEKIAKKHKEEHILVIGNPPWVTNTKLGMLQANNLPGKSNFKNYKGIDAITGKSNFDIGEYILLMMIKAFQHNNSCIALLVKNTTIKNLLFEQKKYAFCAGSFQKLVIDSKKEFNVAVEAALFFCKLNHKVELCCVEKDFYKNLYIKKFGWKEDKFVADLDAYSHLEQIDKISPFEWRQGVKHDCAAVMELEKEDIFFVNQQGEKILLEENLVYGLLKSSDLQKNMLPVARKHVIITQKNVGQATEHLQWQYPLTYEYLQRHKKLFEARKSSIYKNKPSFSIFGIGDYSFKNFKVAISGLYKNARFVLVLPQNNKPVMLDDTCYFLGFDRLEEALYACTLLNAGLTGELLKAIVFPDAKRVFTKEILMRINLLAVARSFSFEQLKKSVINTFGAAMAAEISQAGWQDFAARLQSGKEKQISLF